MAGGTLEQAHLNGRVLVTGGAGFIGSHLVDYLVDRSEAVTVLDDFSTGQHRNLAAAQERGDVRIITGSVLDRSSVDMAVAGCNRVFHLAVQCVRRSLSRPLENHEINATGTLLLLEAARRRGVERFVYCSSSEVYGNAVDEKLSERHTVCAPTTVYGAAKLAGENYTKAYYHTYGLPTVVVRPFNSYGPREHDQGDLAEVIPRFVIRVLNGLPPIIFGDGSNGRDFTFVTETARGLAMAAECVGLIGGEVNIAYGRMISIGDLADTILRLCQRSDLTPMRTFGRPGDVHTLRADTTLARSTLSFVAQIPIEDGLERYLSWFQRTYPDPSVLLEAEIKNYTMPDYLSP
jgi:UDP-glucose 4-epimerase